MIYLHVHIGSDASIPQRVEQAFQAKGTSHVTESIIACEKDRGITEYPTLV